MVLNLRDKLNKYRDCNAFVFYYNRDLESQGNLIDLVWE